MCCDASFGPRRMPPFFSPCRRQRVGSPASVAHLAKSLPSPYLERGLPADDVSQMCLRHRVARGLQSGEIGISTSSLPWVRSMRIQPFLMCCGPSRTTSPRRDAVLRELHDQPLLCTERPIGAILRDLVVGPGVVSFALSVYLMLSG